MGKRSHCRLVGFGILLTAILQGPVAANPAIFVSQRSSSSSYTQNGVQTLLKRAQALAQLRIPYLFGGNDNAGMDCSGSVQRLYQDMGIVLPRNSDRQATHLARQGRLWRVAPWETEEAIFARLQPGSVT